MAAAVTTGAAGVPVVWAGREYSRELARPAAAPGRPAAVASSAPRSSSSREPRQRAGELLLLCLYPPSRSSAAFPLWC